MVFVVWSESHIIVHEPCTQRHTERCLRAQSGDTHTHTHLLTAFSFSFSISPTLSRCCQRLNHSTTVPSEINSLSGYGQCTIKEGNSTKFQKIWISYIMAHHIVCNLSSHFSHYKSFQTVSLYSYKLLSVLDCLTVGNQFIPQIGNLISEIILTRGAQRTWIHVLHFILWMWMIYGYRAEYLGLQLQRVTL